MGEEPFTTVTYVHDILKLAKYSSNGLTDKGDSIEKTGLADQNVEKDLVHTHELCQYIVS